MFQDQDKFFVSKRETLGFNIPDDEIIINCKDIDIDKNKEKNKIKRCQLEGCRKKLKLTDFECRCGNIYCQLHRQINDHQCNFDYKTFDRNNLEKTIKGCKGVKLEGI